MPILKNALLGTARAPLSQDLKDRAASYGISLMQEDAAILLSLIAAENHFLRSAAILPVLNETQVTAPIIEEETLTACSEKRATAIRFLLKQGIELKQPLIFAEILLVLYKKKEHLPPDVLPDFLSELRKYPALWLALTKVLGNFGAWLANENPEWLYAKRSFSDETWLLGSKTERLHFLSILRVRELARAQALVLQTWETESNELKLAILKLIAANLVKTDDKIALEAFQHPRKDIRELGQKLLDALKIVTEEEKSSLTNKIKNWLAPSAEASWKEAIEKTGSGLYSDSALLKKIANDPTQMSPVIVNLLLSKMQLYAQTSTTYSSKPIAVLLLHIAVLAEQHSVALSEIRQLRGYWADSRYAFMIGILTQAEKLLRYRSFLKEE